MKRIVEIGNHMPAQTQVTTPTDLDTRTDLLLAQLQAKHNFWENQATYLRDQLDEVSTALRTHGKVILTDRNGEKTHAIIDLEKHPETDT